MRSAVDRRFTLEPIMTTTRIQPILGALAAITLAASAPRAQADPLPSWNEGSAKVAIVAFVQGTTTQGGPNFVPAEERIATFDQDGTLWTEHPAYSQLMYIFDRVPALVKADPKLAAVEPFKTVMSRNMEAISKLSMLDLEKLAGATLSGMTLDEFHSQVAAWLAQAQDPRWHKHFTDLTYQPMKELMAYLRANGYKTYIVTGGGQDFVRTYAEAVYGIPPEQIIGSAGGVKYVYPNGGTPHFVKLPKMIVNDNDAGKPEAIHLMIGRRPYAAVGNSTGDQQMLEYTKGGTGLRLAMIVLHDDATREYAYGPATGLPDTKVGTFTQALYDEAVNGGWIVISMKRDWKKVFGWE
jgi:phosphoglycolate phosphatase-like HAD superfamily hydrolase